MDRTDSGREPTGSNRKATGGVQNSACSVRPCRHTTRSVVTTSRCATRSVARLRSDFRELSVALPRSRCDRARREDVFVTLPRAKRGEATSADAATWLTGARAGVGSRLKRHGNTTPSRSALAGRRELSTPSSMRGGASTRHGARARSLGRTTRARRHARPGGPLRGAGVETSSGGEKKASAGTSASGS